MADNTTLNTMTGGDTVRDLDRTGVKTQIIALDLNPAGAESLMAGVMPVSDNSGSLTVDNGGTFAVQAVAAGDVADGASDSGNPVKVGAVATSPLGSTTPVSTGQRVNAAADLDGSLIARPMCPLGDILSQRTTDTGGSSTAFTTFSAVASTRNFITTFIFYNDSTTNGFVDIRDGTAGSVLATFPLPAKGGSVINFPVPLRQPTVNTALAYDVSAALTTVYITAIGFQSKS